MLTDVRTAVDLWTGLYFVCLHHYKCGCYGNLTAIPCKIYFFSEAYTAAKEGILTAI
jgi:hypothetical protein